jgi:hypothetical protein
MCLVRDKLLSNMTPRFLTVGDGDRQLPLNVIDDSMTFDRCCAVPVRRNSVLAGLTISWFEESQE